MAYDLLSEALEEVAAVAPDVIAPAPLVPGLELHVDGDYLAYYASGNDETSPGQARQNAIDLLDTYRSRTGAEKIIVHNTAKGCHKGERYLIATVKPYQAQRASGRKPRNHEYLQNWLMEYQGDLFRSKTWLHREADDGIATCSHFAIGKQPGYIAIATADKDMRMLPGLHIDWRSFELTRVEPGAFEVVGTNGKVYGTKWFWLQMLMGDTADHIPGLPGYVATNAAGGEFFKPLGEKTAEKFIGACKNNLEAYGVVFGLYEEFYTKHPQMKSCPYDRFCEQAALLWMRCDTHATVGDFARHMGHSCISKPFCDNMWAAVARLEERVKDQRSTLDALASSND